MSRIRGKDTKPEMLVRKFLHANGFRYRLHVKNLPGKPDIVLPKYKTIIDVRGCFWHSHEECKWGKVRTKSTKVSTNKMSAIERDKDNEAIWRQLGWNVIIVWDMCGLEVKRKKSGKREEIFNAIIRQLKNAP